MRLRNIYSGIQIWTAFLAYSRGLEAEERGDYAEAARQYNEAAAADPNFGEAREKQRTVAAVQVVTASAPGDVTTIGQEVANTGAAGSSPASSMTSALTSSVVDVAGTQAERTTGSGGQHRIDDINRPDTPSVPPLMTIIRIVVTVPIGGVP